VPQGFVDPFEAINVQQHHAQGFALALRMGNSLTESVQQQGPVGQAGQLVVISRVPDVVVGFLQVSFPAAQATMVETDEKPGY